MKAEERSRPAGKGIRAGKGPRKSFRVRKRWAIGLALLAIVGLGLGFSMLPPIYHLPGTPEKKTGADKARKDPRQDPKNHIRKMRSQELRRRFDQAVAMLHARKYEFAIAALHRVIELSPRLPEAHVNMGFALLGLEKHKAAQDFFQGAVALNPRRANAY